MASNLIAFSNRASSISAVLGYFANFDSDWRVKITGASVGGNNQTYTITGTDDRDRSGVHLDGRHVLAG